MKKLFFLFTLCFLFNTVLAQRITTIAGNGTSGAGGDGGPATSATLFAYASAVDRAGNLYISDFYPTSTIRKVNQSGIITTVAGNGTSGFSGDGGAATAAQLNYPRGIAIDAVGNLFVADFYNDRIRKIDTSGIITTVAGTSIAGIHTGYSGDSGQATAARFNEPAAVAFDSYGRLIIVDYGNSRIRRVDTSGIVTTIGGNSSGSTALGDGGAATAAFISNPLCIAVDRLDNIYIGEEGSNRVRIIHPYGIINTIAGNGSFGYSGDGGPATAATLTKPYGVAVNDSGYVYIADHENNRIRVVNPSGTITTIAGTGTAGYSGDLGPATSAQLNLPSGISFDKLGNAYICDFGNYVVRYLLLNRAPVFTGGHHQNMSVCESASATSIDTLLAAIDSEAGQLQTWSVISYPPHGYVSASYSSVSTGSMLTPSGLTYYPIPLYSGFDTFSVRVSDGYRSDTTTVVINVISFPSAGYVRGADSTCPGAYDTLSNPTGTPGGTWSTSSTAFATIDATSGILFAITPGSEVVYYSVTTACGTATAHLNVTVNNNPISGRIDGVDSICVGSATLLVDTTGTPGGVWTSTDTSIATVSSSGLVYGVHGGVVYILYNAYTHCGSAPAIHRLEVKPNAGFISGRDTVCLGDTINLSETVYTGGTWSSSATSIATVDNSGIVTARALGISNISFTVTAGACGTAIATHPVHVITVPAAGSISGSTTICRGSTATLSGSVAGGIWASSDTSVALVGASTGIVHGAGAGVAAITYSVTNFCGTTFTSRTVNVDTTLVVTPIIGADSFCVGTHVFEVSSPTGGIWTLHTGHVAVVWTGSDSSQLFGISRGYDSLTYTVANGCGTASQVKQIKVLVQPYASSITGTGAICIGDSAILSDSTASGTWSVSNTNASISPGGLLRGITNGVDTVLYLYTNSCGTDTAMHIVTINPPPSIAAISGPSVVCPGSSAVLTDATAGGSWSASNSNATVVGGLVTGVAVGTDTISYTVTTSCGASGATKIITISPTLTPSVTNSVMVDSIVCSGEGVTFIATATNGGTSPYIRWFKSGVPVSTGATYSYTPINGDMVKCLLASSNTCALHDTVVSNTITMTVNPYIIPVTLITATPNDTVAFRGQAITFTTGLIDCGPSPLYQWFLNGAPVSGATDSTYSVNVFSDDTVFCIVTCNNSCISTTYNHSNTIVVSSTPLSINNLDVAITNLSISPNPSNREFYLDGRVNNPIATPLAIEIIDMPGRVLYRSSLLPQKGYIHHRIHLDGNIPAGQYMLRVVTNMGAKVLRFVVAD